MKNRGIKIASFKPKTLVTMTHTGPNCTGNPSEAKKKKKNFKGWKILATGSIYHDKMYEIGIKLWKGLYTWKERNIS